MIGDPVRHLCCVGMMIFICTPPVSAFSPEADCISVHEKNSGDAAFFELENTCSYKIESMLCIADEDSKWPCPSLREECTFFYAPGVRDESCRLLIDRRSPYKIKKILLLPFSSIKLYESNEIDQHPRYIYIAACREPRRVQNWTPRVSDDRYRIGTEYKCDVFPRNEKKLLLRGQ